MAVTVSVIGQLGVTDNSSGSVAQSMVVNLGFTGTVQSFAETISLSTSPTTISLPINPVQFLYLQNLDTSNAIIVTWTPTGGSSNIVLNLDPGGTTIFCETQTTNGISALVLQASAGTPAIKYILAG